MEFYKPFTHNYFKTKMSTTILTNYGISFKKISSKHFLINANSDNLAIFLDKLAMQKEMLQGLVNNINSALSGNSILAENEEWSVELGLQIYTGLIKNNSKFELFIEDYYNQTLETYSLSDMKIILQSLLIFVQS